MEVQEQERVERLIEINSAVVPYCKILPHRNQRWKNIVFSVQGLSLISHAAGQQDEQLKKI